MNSQIFSLRVWVTWEIKEWGIACSCNDDDFKVLVVYPGQFQHGELDELSHWREEDNQG